MCVTVNEVSSRPCKSLTLIIAKTYLQTGETIPHHSTPSCKHVKATSHVNVRRLAKRLQPIQRFTIFIKNLATRYAQNSSGKDTHHATDVWHSHSRSCNML